MRTCHILVAWSFVVPLLAGCPGPAPDRSTTDKTAASEVSDSGYKRRKAEDLPAVTDYLPPLDDGRIEIAGPDGWNTLPRNSKSLTGFVKGKSSELPRIVVTASDPPAPKLADTTDENADVLAAMLEAQLRKDTKKVVPEHCLPIVLGEHTFIRHVRLATLGTGGDPVVIQSLQTVRGGRMYTVELICTVNAADRREYVKSLKNDRDFGYAVAANLKFGTAADPLAGVAAEPAADPPAPLSETPAPPAETPVPTTPAPTTPAPPDATAPVPPANPAPTTPQQP